LIRDSPGTVPDHTIPDSGERYDHRTATSISAGISPCIGYPDDARRIARNTSPTIGVQRMCRNIRPLFNFDPPVTEEEIRAAALQFVRKVSGFNNPSKANEGAFLAAVEEISTVCRNLVSSLRTNAQPRNRAEEAARAQARALLRFSR
jgi:hypothetical protein